MGCIPYCIESTDFMKHTGLLLFTDINVSLSGKQLQTGAHILVSDIGRNSGDGLSCYSQSDRVRWYHRLKGSHSSEMELDTYGNNRGWYRQYQFNTGILTRRSGIPATEGILTCKNGYYGYSSVSVEVHYQVSLCA